MSSKSELHEPDAKKQKPNVAETSKFTNFEVVRVLSENSQRKMICMEGKFTHDMLNRQAVVILEKTPITEETAKQMLTSQSQTQTDIQNDIYGTYQLYPKQALSGVKTTMIYPATQKHIDKYSQQEMFLVEETPENYKNITLPHIESSNFSIQWVDNILEHKSELDRIVFEDPDPDVGFILLPDMKWNRKQVEDLYLVAIIHKMGIKSLRDLNQSHLVLLKNIRDKSLKAIEATYGVPGSKLRVYLHYQPSYYHLHVHFTHLRYDAPGSGVEKAHLLSDVIDNLTLDPDFYHKKTLSFLLRNNEALCVKYKEAGIV